MLESSFRDLFENRLSEKDARDLLIELYNKPEHTEDLTICAKVMREYSTKLKLPQELEDKIIDNCGTGGDKSGTFNVSTTVSIILASMGCYVAKHGNRSVTSKSGSADVLEELGVNLNLSLEAEATLLIESNFTFMFAINHHSAMRHIMPIRKSIPHRTIFNLLGPITNPAGAKKQLIGVFAKYFVPKIAKTLRNLDTVRAMVVSGADGLDEASICDITHCSFLNSGEIKNFELNPIDFGLKLSTLSEIEGGDAKVNAKMLYDILNGDLEGARVDIVLLNSALGFMVDGLARDIQDGLEIARESIKSKKAISKLKKIIEVSNKL